jgi:uncharacterized protein (TIGR04255 family)
MNQPTPRYVGSFWQSVERCLANEESTIMATTTTNTKYNPLEAPVPDNILLPNAPLVRVIARVSFPEILALNTPQAEEKYIAPFQELMRAEYPGFSKEETPVLSISGNAPPTIKAQPHWRFFDLNKQWRITIAPDFVALETSAYVSRAHFLSRLRLVVETAQKVLHLTAASRLGLRYISRVVKVDFETIQSFIREEVRGVVTTQLHQALRLSVTQNIFSLPQYGATLSARWGLIPANQTVDPNAVEPVAERSWILDFDVASEENRAIDVEETSEIFRYFAEREYTFFRWVVSEEFLLHYGGKP